MADWWTATAENYFGRVSKPMILSAVTEATSAQAAENLAGLKKAELAAEAEKRLADKAWLPAMLRPVTEIAPAPVDQQDEDREDAEADDLSDEGVGDEGEDADAEGSHYGIAAE